jgi:hypothetical protein
MVSKRQVGPTQPIYIPAIFALVGGDDAGGPGGEDDIGWNIMPAH